MPITIRKRSRLSKATLVVANNGQDDIEFWDVKLGEVVAPAEDDKIVTINSTNRVDEIAQKFYGDYRLWDVIGDANGFRVLPIDMRTGDLVRVPSFERVTREIRTGIFRE